jgi:GNAT superfamily N-acetyltransferase
MPVITREDFADHYHMTVEFKVSASLREEPADGDFVHEISGRILASYEDDENWEEAGALHASLVQFNEALKHGIDTDRIGDGISGEVAEYWECLFDVNTGDLKPEIRVEYETVGCNLLIIDFIEVYPKFRGHGIGLAGVQRVVDVFGAGCALVAGMPQPLQFTPSFASDPDKLNRLQAPNFPKRQATHKLQNYWSRAGFRPLGRTGIYLMNARVEAKVVDSFDRLESLV